MTKINAVTLSYLLHSFDFYISDLLSAAIYNDEDIPFSAEKSAEYIDIWLKLKQLNSEETDCITIEDYLKKEQYTEEECAIYNEKIKINENYYIIYKLLIIMDRYVQDIVIKVLNDSEEDPHYSAVDICNVVKCYISLMTEIGVKLSFNDVNGYLLYNKFTLEECKIFEQKREEESKYYIGEQF